MKHKTGERFKIIADKLFEGNISEMARMMGMTPQSFNKYAQGETLPGGIILKRVISLGVNLNWLLVGIPPMMISDINEAGALKLPEKDRKPLPEEEKESKNQDNEQKEMPDFFAHINEEELNEVQRDLFVEVKQFSDFLKTAQLPFQVKRLMLQLMIEHIDQEIVRLQNKDS